MKRTLMPGRPGHGVDGVVILVAILYPTRRVFLNANDIDSPSRPVYTARS